MPARFQTARYVFSVLLLALVSHPSIAQYPNIIVILADDMGSDSVSAFNESLGFKTPRLDRLVKESMIFTDGHSGSAVCSPTRYGLLTGRYAWRSRLKRGVIQSWDAPLIEEERLTIGAMLQRKGYHTACIGKWHLGWNWPFRSEEEVPVGDKKELADLASKGVAWTNPILGGPVDRGFDYHFGDDIINWAPFVYIENRKALSAPELANGWKAADSDWAEVEVLPKITANAVAYIEKQAKTEQPFFLYFPMTSPHAPIAPSDPFKGISGISPYVDFVMQTDHSIGQLVDAVEQAGIAENTLIIVTADNGTSLNFPQNDGTLDKGVSFNTNLRGGKADIWEGGHKVPFIVRWPGHVKASSQNDTPVCLTDIMATVADITGVDLPDSSAEDSVSFLPALLSKTFKRDAIIHHSITGKFAIREGEWKLAFSSGSGGWASPKDAEADKLNLPKLQLYNISEDPLETTNRFKEHPELVQRLTEKLRGIIQNGRSTKGAYQSNVGETWMP